MNARSSIVRGLLVVGLIYAMNLALIPLNELEIGKAVANQLVVQGLPRIRLLEDIEGGLTFGFILGEMGCLALWFNLSSMRLLPRLLIYLIAAVQLTILLLFIGAGNVFEFVLEEFLAYLGVSIGLLVFTSIAMRLSLGRPQLVKAGVGNSEVSYPGVTISQLVFATTIIALTLAAAYANRAPDTSETLDSAVFAILIASATGLLPTAGLWIGTSLRRWLIQLVACLIASAVAAVVVEENSPWKWESICGSCVVMFCIVVLPVFCVRVARRLGYEVRYIDRNQTADAVHPFMDSAAKEPNE